MLVTGDGPIPTYESFTLPDPPRLVVDIPNAVHAIAQPIRARPPLVTAVRSSQYRERPVQIVRLVLDLRAALPYRVMTSQNQLRVDIGAPAEATASAPAATPAAAVAKAAGKVTRVDVQSVRGRQQILIRTSGPVTYAVSEGTEPLSLAVDVAGATIEPSAARTVDLRQVEILVLDDGHPVGILANSASGIISVETNIELEDNVAVQNHWKYYDARQHKRRRCFLKSLAR